MTNQMIYSVPTGISSGIYKIIAPTKHFYIGSSKMLGERCNRHWKKLLKGKHWNKYVQSVFNKDSVGWEFTLLKPCEGKDVLLNEEQIFLDECFGKSGCMNASPSARCSYGMLNKRHSLETRKQMSVDRAGRSNPAKGRKDKPDVIEQKRLRRLGKKNSLESKIKTGASLMGIKRSAETREKMSYKKPRSTVVKIELSKWLKFGGRNLGVSKDDVFGVIRDPNTSDKHLDLALAYCSY